MNKNKSKLKWERNINSTEKKLGIFINLKLNKKDQVQMWKAVC